MADDQDFTEEVEQRLDDLGNRIEEVRSNPDVQEVMGKTSDEGSAERSEEDDKELHESGEEGKGQDDEGQDDEDQDDEDDEDEDEDDEDDDDEDDDDEDEDQDD